MVSTSTPIDQMYEEKKKIVRKQNPKGKQLMQK